MIECVKDHAFAAGLLIVFFTTLTIVNSQVNIDDGTLRMIWLASAEKVVDIYSASNIMGGVTYALDQLTANTSLLPSYNSQPYNITLRYADSNCSSKYALSRVLDVLELDDYIPDVVFGTLCHEDTLPNALLCSVLNIPLFLTLGDNANIANSTVVKVDFADMELFLALHELLETFSWRHISMVSSDVEFFTYKARILEEIVLNHNDENHMATLGIWERNVNVTPGINQIRDIYKRLKTTASIIIFFVPLSELGDWIYASYLESMDNGDYVFVYVYNFHLSAEKYHDVKTLSLWLTSLPDVNDRLKRAFQNCLIIIPQTEGNVEDYFNNFYSSANTSVYSQQIGVTPEKPHTESAFVYDSIILYSYLAKTHGGHVYDGIGIHNAARNLTFTGGATGVIEMDHYAERVSTFQLLNLGADQKFHTIGHSYLESGTEKWRLNESELLWGNGRYGIAGAPSDRGFLQRPIDDGFPQWIFAIISFLVALIISALGFLIFKTIQYEHDVNEMSWIVNFKDVKLQTEDFRSVASEQTHATGLTGITHSTKWKSQPGVIGTYRGSIVVVKEICEGKVIINRKLKVKMEKMKAINHININSFLGASIEPPNICMLWEYCSKGSLHSILLDPVMKIDVIYQFSMASDVLTGLDYLHTKLDYHGNLNSLNVVVDGRWVARLTDFGQEILLDGNVRLIEDPDVFFLSLLWMAPEVIQLDSVDTLSDVSPDSWPRSPEADVYAVGIIFKELFCRTEPYEEDGLSAKEIVHNILNDPDYRPSLNDIGNTFEHSNIPEAEVKELITMCWNSEPTERPTPLTALDMLTHINPVKKTSVMDNLVRRLEHYSQQLEELVDQTTLSLQAEQEKTEKLLLRMLPLTIMKKLRIGEDIKPQAFGSVSIMFSSIHDFSLFSSNHPADTVITLLNTVYSFMDSVIAELDVYKVETVGDVYVLASGLPMPNGRKHIAYIASCALNLMAGIVDLSIPDLPNHVVKLKMGINTGPIVATVVGIAMPRYCLFGDCINVSARMMTKSICMGIQMSPSSYSALCQFSGFIVADRGFVNIKGKGRMHTYWLVGKDDIIDGLPLFFDSLNENDETITMMPETCGDSKYDDISRSKMDQIKPKQSTVSLALEKYFDARRSSVHEALVENPDPAPMMGTVQYFQSNGSSTQINEIRRISVSEDTINAEPKRRKSISDNFKTDESIRRPSLSENSINAERKRRRSVTEISRRRPSVSDKFKSDEAKRKRSISENSKTDEPKRKLSASNDENGNKFEKLPDIPSNYSVKPSASGTKSNKGSEMLVWKAANIGVRPSTMSVKSITVNYPFNLPEKSDHLVKTDQTRKDTQQDSLYPPDPHENKIWENAKKYSDSAKKLAQIQSNDDDDNDVDKNEEIQNPPKD